MHSTFLATSVASLTLLCAALSAATPALQRSQSLPTRPARLTAPGFPTHYTPGLPPPNPSHVMTQGVGPQVRVNDPRNAQLQRRLDRKVQNLNSSKHQYSPNNPYDRRQLQKIDGKVQLAKNTNGIEKWRLAGEQRFGIQKPGVGPMTINRCGPTCDGGARGGRGRV